ncbi:MAG: hypothetical protein ABIF77_10010, partial [bacterium]
MQTTRTCGYCLVLALMLAPGAIIAQQSYSLIDSTRTAVDSLAAGGATPQVDWITPEAARDSLDTFWQGLDETWLQPMPAEMRGFSLDPAAIDSMTEVGDEAVAELLAGSLWRVSFQPLSRNTFNRVEGHRLGGSMRLQILGPNRPELTLGAGYGFASKKIVYDGALELPLLIQRPQSLTGRPTGRPWPGLAFRASGGLQVQRFAGDDRGLRT